MTIQDYYNDQTDCPDYIVAHLNKVDEAIQQLGFSWYAMTKQQWIDVFKAIQPTSFSVKNRYRNTALKFLYWLENKGEISKKDNILAEYNPKLGSEIPFADAQMYVSDLPTLVEAMEKTSPSRDSTILNNLATALLWYQFNAADCANITLDNVYFYHDKKQINGTSSIKDITRCVIQHKDKVAIINNPDVLRYVYSAYNRAYAKEPHGILFQEKGKHITQKSILRRLQRSLIRINEYCDLELTITSVRLSGQYHKVYIGWKALGYSWDFIPYTRDQFSKLLGRPIAYEASYREEYARFMSYVHATQDEDID